jgi:hypothetical protein
VPTLESAQLPLTALSIALEGRYRLTPRLYAAGRTEHLGFSEVTGTLRRDSWDAPVTRVEVGGGYALTRNVTVKLSFQHNRRPAGRVTHVDAVGAQIGYWF